LAKVEQQPGAPWGGAGNCLSALHEMTLAQKGRSVNPQPHQRAWSMGMRRPSAPLADRSLIVTRAQADADPHQRTVKPHAERQGGPRQKDNIPCAIPAAGLSSAECDATFIKWRPARAKVHPSFDSGGFVTQLEDPLAVTEPFRTELVPPSLKKTAVDEIREDNSAASQIRRGRVQSSVQPGTQPVPRRPSWAPVHDRSVHPTDSPTFDRMLWYGAGSGLSGLGCSRAWSMSPRWAPVRCGQSIVRLKRKEAWNEGLTNC